MITRLFIARESRLYGLLFTLAASGSVFRWKCDDRGWKWKATGVRDFNDRFVVFTVGRVWP